MQKCKTPAANTSYRWNAPHPKRTSDWPWDVGIGCLVDSDRCDLSSSGQGVGGTSATSHGGREGVGRTCGRNASFIHMVARLQLWFGLFCTKIWSVSVEQGPHRQPGRWSTARGEAAGRAFWPDRGSGNLLEASVLLIWQVKVTHDGKWQKEEAAEYIAAHTSKQISVTSKQLGWDTGWGGIERLPHQSAGGTSDSRPSAAEDGLTLPRLALYLRLSSTTHAPWKNPARQLLPEKQYCFSFPPGALFREQKGEQGRRKQCEV